MKKDFSIFPFKHEMTFTRPMSAEDFVRITKKQKKELPTQQLKLQMNFLETKQAESIYKNNDSFSQMESTELHLIYEEIGIREINLRAKMGE